MSTKEKIYSSLSMLAILFIAIIVLISLHQTPQQSTPVSGGGFTHGFCDTNGNSGTTSPLSYQYSAAASTTLPCYTNSADQIDLQLYVVSSSTASTVTYQVQYSNDAVTWYGEGGAGTIVITNPSTVTESSSTVTHSWTPGTTATSTKDVKIININSNYTRIVFGETGAGYGLYSALINRNITKN